MTISDISYETSALGVAAQDQPDSAIVVCIDEKFAFQAMVTLTSVLLNSASRESAIFVIASKLSLAAQRNLDNLGRKFGATITVLNVDDGPFKSLQTYFHWSHAIYLRWLAPALIPASRLIYLDSDLIVQADIRNLYECFQPGMVVGGVQDVKGGAIRREALGLERDEPYLNSGVLLIDGRIWREENLLGELVSFAQNYKGKLFGADQDVLNVVFAGKKYLVPEKWNVQQFSVGYYGYSKKMSIDTFEGIFHFSGEVKPWMRWADPWCRQMYLKYASLLGLPEGFWQEPQTVQQKLLQARAADEENDHVSANLLRKQVISFMLKNGDRSILSRKLT